ncbi:hypothetical protein [Pontivivens ytuae]|nr:hypothetical protein [Pontivivens ytuae]
MRSVYVDGRAAPVWIGLHGSGRVEANIGHLPSREEMARIRA